MKEKYLFELGGENTELGKYEALELLEYNNYEPKLEKDYGKVIAISSSKLLTNKIISRLSMTKRLSKIIFHSQEKKINHIINDLDPIEIGQKSFAIRQIGKSNLDEKKTAISIGKKVSDINKTSLDNPEVTILFYQNKDFFISLKLDFGNTAYKRCLKHHISQRPYFSPIGIHPRIARAMVNLSNCKENEILVDPFCGTGGILIEAADMNLNIIGIDLKEKMVEYSTGNLKHFGFKGKMIESDFEKINDIKFNSIVCDPPYGIASTTGGEEISSLIKRFIRSIENKMIKGQRLVIALNDTKLLKKQKLKIIYQFKWYIHKSLTRNIMVLEKINI